MLQPETFHFPPAGTVPNNRLPVILHRGAFDASTSASVYEKAFARHGWVHAWRNGVYPFQHFHSTSHEVLGIARGRAMLRLGGEPGRDVPVLAGDVIILPAGTGHRRISSEGSFLVIGAYPDGRPCDLLEADTLSDAEVAVAEKRIAALPIPARDPVTGESMEPFWSDLGLA